MSVPAVQAWTPLHRVPTCDVGTVPALAGAQQRFWILSSAAGQYLQASSNTGGLVVHLQREPLNHLLPASCRCAAEGRPAAALEGYIQLYYSYFADVCIRQAKLKLSTGPELISAH